MTYLHLLQKFIYLFGMDHFWHFFPTKIINQPIIIIIIIVRDINILKVAFKILAQNNPLDQYSCTKKLNVKWGYDLHVWLMKRSSWKWQWNWMQVNTLLLGEIGDVFKSFQNGLANSWAIFLSAKTSYGKIVYSPSEILIGVKQEGQKAARKRRRPRTWEKSTLVMGKRQQLTAHRNISLSFR